MTKREAIENTIKQWEYIKQYKLYYEGEYFKVFKDKKAPIQNSYLCQYCYDNATPDLYYDDYIDCSQCINWNKNNNHFSTYCCNKTLEYHKIVEKTKPAFEVADDMLLILNRELEKEIKRENRRKEGIFKYVYNKFINSSYR